MARFDVYISDDGLADIDGDPVVPEPDESVHEAVLDQLQRYAQEYGTSVEATVTDGPGDSYFVLEVAPDGSSRVLIPEDDAIEDDAIEGDAIEGHAIEGDFAEGDFAEDGSTGDGSTGDGAIEGSFAEVSPSEESFAEEAFAEVSPSEEAFAEESPSEEAFYEESFVEEAPSAYAPTEEALSAGFPSAGFPSAEILSAEAPFAEPLAATTAPPPPAPAPAPDPVPYLVPDADLEPAPTVSAGPAPALLVARAPVRTPVAARRSPATAPAPVAPRTAETAAPAPTAFPVDDAVSAPTVFPVVETAAGPTAPPVAERVPEPAVPPAAETVPAVTEPPAAEIPPALTDPTAVETAPAPPAPAAPTPARAPVSALAAAIGRARAQAATGGVSDEAAGGDRTGAGSGAQVTAFASVSAAGTGLPPEIAERIGRINALSAIGRLDEAFADATALRESLTDAVGAEHAHTLEARSVEAYLAYLRGEYREATVLALAVARIRCGAMDERASTEVARAAAAWQRLDDDVAALVHGRELLHMWDRLQARGPLPSGHAELAERIRGHVEELEEYV
ncbi:hypothetical protein ACFC09_07885 [Streptomyces sp. NPDC056161]|uniref:hypothetical protein n=1 Tax=Streptomyces sp. NPDC056161 TaxID=3345732 RepID=UPI0035E106A7